MSNDPLENLPPVQPWWQWNQWPPAVKIISLGLPAALGLILLLNSSSSGPSVKPRPTPSTTPAAAPQLEPFTSEPSYELSHLANPLNDQPAKSSSLPGSSQNLSVARRIPLNTLERAIHLNLENSHRWTLKTAAGASLLSPIDLTISAEGLYVIERGHLYRADWPISSQDDALILRPILTLETKVAGYPIKEIVAVEVIETGGVVFVLDKANDIYRYEPDDGTWSLETPAASTYTDPDPLYLNLASYNDRLYLLDPARNQIWRHPPSAAGAGFLPGVLPWLTQPDEPNVNLAVDLAIDGNIYVLQRDGVIVTYDPVETARFDLAAVDASSSVSSWSELPIQPVAIFATVEGTMLHVADAGRRRIVTFDRTTGKVLQQLVAPDNLDFAALHAIVEKEDYLYILAGAHLYRYRLNLELSRPPRSKEQSVIFRPPPITDLAPADLLPNDPRLPAALAAYNFHMPLRDALLPDRGAVYPGSRRAYRYDVHQGLDLYGRDIGLALEVGTPVYAAAAGVVLRADTDYQEMTLDEVHTLLDEANARHITPLETLEKLNGRQVWVDHGGGVVTRYSHLSGIAENLTVGQPVAAGQLIGYVGLSGTPDGIEDNTQFPHLHFEIRFGPGYQYYLGQWLTIEATRRAFEQIFKVPVRPAYLELPEPSETNLLETAAPGVTSWLPNSAPPAQAGLVTRIEPFTYTIRAGDNLSDISQLFGLDHPTLAAANDLTDASRLAVGQQLRIPGVALTGRVLGYSSQGWPIELYQIGHGPRRVAFIGGIHGGYEWNSILLAYAAISYFQAHPDQIPDSVSLFIIPAANPDGQVAIIGHTGRFSSDEAPGETAEDALLGRFNNRQVDLNRNWDCEWQPGGRWREEEIKTGDAPFSEIETQLLRDFLTKPPMGAVIFWHSALPGVFAGGCETAFPAAETLASVYAQAADYPLPGEFDLYPVTGDATDWLAEQNIPAITVELTNHTDLDWAQNLAGMRAVLKLVDSQ